MNEWMLLVILAAFTWAIVNTIDKFVITKWVKNVFVPLVIGGIISTLVALLVYFIYDFSELSYFNIFLAILAGVFYLLMGVFYFKALQVEEMSRIIPLFYISPLLILFLAAIFLGETLTLPNYLGVILLVIGSILISIKKLALKLKLGKGFWLMMLSILALTVYAIITKYLLDFANFWTVFSYTRFGVGIAIIPLIFLSIRDLMSDVKEHGKRVIGMLSLSEGLNLIAVLFLIMAFAIGSVTLVTALSSIQPLFVLAIAIFLSIFFPKIIKEEIGRKTILLKALAIIIMFIGIILII